MGGLLERLVRPFVPAVGNGEKAKSDAILRQLDRLDVRMSAIEEERERSLAALTELFDGLPAYIIYKDGRNRLVMVNDYAASAVGKRAEDLIGREAAEVWPDAQEHYAEDARIMETGRAPRTQDAELTLPNGVIHRVRTWKRPVHDALGVVVGVVMFALDLDAICAPEKCPVRPSGPYAPPA